MIVGEECQRQGTEYKLPRGRRKVQDPDKQEDLSEGDVVLGQSDDADEGKISETDSLSDLYPGNPLNSSLGIMLVTNEWTLCSSYS